MVAHAWNPRTWQTEARDHKFTAILSYIESMRPAWVRYLVSKNKQQFISLVFPFGRYISLRILRWCNSKVRQGWRVSSVEGYLVSVNKAQGSILSTEI